MGIESKHKSTYVTQLFSFLLWNMKCGHIMVNLKMAERKTDDFDEAARHFWSLGLVGRRLQGVWHSVTQCDSAGGESRRTAPLLRRGENEKCDEQRDEPGQGRGAACNNETVALCTLAPNHVRPGRLSFTHHCTASRLCWAGTRSPLCTCTSFWCRSGCTLRWGCSPGARCTACPGLEGGRKNQINDCILIIF